MNEPKLDPHNSSHDGVSWRLYLPLEHDLDWHYPWLALLLTKARGRANILVVQESAADNLAFLRLLEPTTRDVGIYLAELRGGSSASVSHWIGEQEVRSAIESRVLPATLRGSSPSVPSIENGLRS